MFATSRKESVGSEVSNETATNYTKALFAFFSKQKKDLSLYILKLKKTLKQNYACSACKCS